MNTTSEFKVPLKTDIELAEIQCIQAEAMIMLAEERKGRGLEYNAYIVDAIEIYQDLLKSVGAKLAQPYLGMAYIAMATGKHEEAIHLLNTAEQIEPGNLHVHKVKKQMMAYLKASDQSAKALSLESIGRLNEEQDDGFVRKQNVLTRIIDPLLGMFENPKALLSLFKKVYHYTLSRGEAEWFFKLIQNDVPDTELKNQVLKLKEFIGKVSPEDTRNMRGFVEKLADDKETVLKAWSRNLARLKSVDNPKALYTLCQQALETQLGKDEAPLLYQLIQDKAEPENFENYQTAIHKICPDYLSPYDLKEISESLDIEPAKDPRIVLRERLAPLQGKIKNPKHLFTAVKKASGLELSKSKTEGLFNFIHLKSVSGKANFGPKDLSKFQQLLGEMKLLNPKQAKSSGEYGQEVGEHTQKALNKLVKALLKNLD